MSAALLARVRSLGISIAADGKDLIVRPRSMLTPDLRASLRAAKPDLLASLRAEAETNALAQASAPAAAPAATVTHNGADAAASEPSKADADLLGPFRFRLPPGAAPQVPLPPILAAIAQEFGGLEALTFRLLPTDTKPSLGQSETNASTDCQQRAAGGGVPEGPDGQDAFDTQGVAERLCGLLDAQDARQLAHAAEAARTNRSPLTPTARPPEPLVHRLATALATPRPWQRIGDPEGAHSYFEARAGQMLATASDPLALVEREEREAARLSTTNSGVEQ